MQKQIKVKLIKSRYGRLPKHAATLKGLGLSRINQERDLPDTPAVRGMIKEVNYLVEVVGESKGASS